MRYFLDTNIFLRFLVADNAVAHRDCQLLLELVEAKRIKAITSALVFAEIVWTLQSFYKFPRVKISEALKILARSGITFDNRMDALRALEWYGAHAIKFIDAMLASHPSVHAGKVVLVSYDRDFDILGVKRIEPREILKRLKIKNE